MTSFLSPKELIPAKKDKLGEFTEWVKILLGAPEAVG